MGSLGFDLSPLGPLYYSLVNSSKLKTVLIGGSAVHQVELCPLLSTRWFEISLRRVKATDIPKKSENAPPKYL